MNMYFYLVRDSKTKWEKYRCLCPTDLDFNPPFASCLILASCPEFLVSSVQTKIKPSSHRVVIKLK